MKNPISVGVVGCGYWGPNHIRNFRMLPDCTLKAMCDMNEATSEAPQRAVSGS